MYSKAFAPKVGPLTLTLRIDHHSIDKVRVRREQRVSLQQKWLPVPDGHPQRLRKRGEDVLPLAGPLVEEGELPPGLLLVEGSHPDLLEVVVLHPLERL